MAAKKREQKPQTENENHGGYLDVECQKLRIVERAGSGESKPPTENAAPGFG